MSPVAVLITVLVVAFSVGAFLFLRDTAPRDKDVDR